jgi:CheY-like chemotaxis protein
VNAFRALASCATGDLVVEDDVLLRWVTADSLRESGFAVIEAANSAEAVRVMEATPVDALFSDITCRAE